MATMAITMDDDMVWQPDAGYWHFYRKDLKVSRMVITHRRPVLDFEIPILPQPRRYQPGSVPPAEPVELTLESDAHIDETQRAFIVDKVILPLEPFTELNDPRQKRAHYIIGWPDLPGARPTVDCTQALEYVAPYEIERWEFQNFLHREEAKEEAEADAAIAAVAAAIAAEKDVGSASAAPHTAPSGQNKRGRKPKNARLLDARAPTPELDSEQEDMLAKRKQRPSLSTPQKSRIAQLDAELEMDLLENMGYSVEGGGDADELVQQQLQSEIRDKITDSMDEDGYGYEDEVDFQGAETAASVLESSSRASTAKAPTWSKALDSSSVSGATPAQQHLPQRPPVSVAASLSSRGQRPLSASPISLPQHPGSFSRITMSSSPAQTIISSTESRTPRAPAPQLAAAAAALGSHSRRGQTAPFSTRPPPSSNGHGGFTPTNNLTPRPSKRAAEGSIETQQRKAPKLSKAPPEPEPEPQPEHDYVVKRLEADEILDGTHWFRVRWEGEWPPDQNPTWEPRDNISAKLVKAYLKRKAEREAKGAAKATSAVKGATSSIRPGQHSAGGKRQSTLKEWARKSNYSSVSEAFEGKAELPEQTGGEAAREDDHRADDEDELAGDADEFLIVDKGHSDAPEMTAVEVRKSLKAQLATSLANM